jgi:hypothetical protein
MILKRLEILSSNNIHHRYLANSLILCQNQRIKQHKHTNLDHTNDQPPLKAVYFFGLSRRFLALLPRKDLQAKIKLTCLGAEDALYLPFIVGMV